MKIFQRVACLILVLVVLTIGWLSFPFINQSLAGPHAKQPQTRRESNINAVINERKIIPEHEKLGQEQLEIIEKQKQEWEGDDSKEWEQEEKEQLEMEQDERFRRERDDLRKDQELEEKLKRERLEEQIKENAKLERFDDGD